MESITFGDSLPGFVAGSATSPAVIVIQGARKYRWLGEGGAGTLAGVHWRGAPPGGWALPCALMPVVPPPAPPSPVQSGGASL